MNPPSPPFQAAGPLTYHWLKQPEDFQPWVEEWMGLMERAAVKATPFHHPAWIEGCWRCPRSRIAVGLIREAGRLRGGLVFNAEYDAGSAVLVPVRLLSLTPHISSAHPACLVALAEPGLTPESFGPLLDQALRSLRWHALFLNFLNPEYEWLERAIRGAAQARGWTVQDGESSTDAYMDIEGGVSAYLGRRGQNFRKNQRRAKTHLQSLGTVEAVELATNSSIPDSTIQREILDAFHRCWQRDSVHSPLHPAVRDSMLALVAAMRAAGMLRAYFLKVNEESAAFEFGFADLRPGGIYYPCVRGYDAKFRKCSPGNLLAEFTIEDSARRGLRGIYLGAIHLSEDTAYKKTWMTEEWTVRNCMIVPGRSPYGLLLSAYNKFPAFRKVWWKFRLGELAKQIHWKIDGPTG